MRVSKQQIVKGLTDYIQNEIIPKLENEKAMQIILSVGLNAAMANTRMVDAVLGNAIVGSMLGDDGTGTYEIGGIADAMRTSIEQYGNFPVCVPAIPLLSPREITLKLNANDIDALRRYIESAM